MSLLASGCAYRGPLTRVAVDHNELVANSVNQLMLLNVLRAKEREPLHFTSISKLTGNVSAVGVAGANTQVREQASMLTTAPAGVTRATTEGGEIATPSLQLQVTAGSSFDVGVFDTQEFYQGLTSSVSPATIAHYLHQGWPAELLTYLAVGSVDLVAPKRIKVGDKTYEKGQVVRTLINDPDDPDEALRFEAFAKCYVLTWKARSTPNQKLMRLSDVKDIKLAELALFDGDKFDVDPPPKPGDPPPQPGDPPPERWIVRVGKSSETLTLRPTRARGCENGAQEVAANPQGVTETARAFSYSGLTVIDPAKSRATDGREAVAAADVMVDGQSVNLEFVLVLRATDGMIYFLGEYARDRAHKYEVPGHAKGTTLPILKVAKSKPDGQIFVSVNHRGKRHYMAADESRGSQAFALIEQLINLQKMAKDKPSTQTVRVVE